MAGHLSVMSTVMRISQIGDAIVVDMQGAEEVPGATGAGVVSADTLTIRYEYQAVRHYSSTVSCTLAVIQDDEASVEGEQMIGRSSATVALSGNSCPFIGLHCGIGAEFTATRVVREAGRLAR